MSLILLASAVTVGAAVKGKWVMLKLAVQRSEGMLHNAWSTNHPLGFAARWNPTSLSSQLKSQFSKAHNQEERKTPRGNERTKMDSVNEIEKRSEWETDNETWRKQILLAYAN